MKLPLLLLLLQLLICCLLQVPEASATCHFPAIFNFGDSNSDTGGLSALFGSLNRPFGETYFKKPSGRNSDGRLVIDFIAESLGLPFLSPYLDSIGTNFSHGASFATSASTIVRQNLTLFQGGYSPVDLRIQLSEFKRFMLQSQTVYQQGGVFQELLPKSEYFSSALYTIDIGQNDVTALFERNIPSDTYIPNALSQLYGVIKTIYAKAGGRHFWIHNTGPLGCLPYALMRRPSTAAGLDSAGCSIFFNELAQKFNNMLSKKVAWIRTKLPDATFVLVDMYSVKYSIFSQSTKFGFEQPLKSCCGYGGGAYNFDFIVRCGYPVKANGTKRAATWCENPAKSVIWDGIHFTDAANKVVFDQISGGSFSDPPVALDMACRKMSPSV